MGKFVQDGTGIVVYVDDSKDHRFTSGWRRDGEKSNPAKSETPDKSWKNEDLVTYTNENSVDIGDATKKEDLLAAIELHREALADNA